MSRLLFFLATVYLARVLGASLFGVLGVASAVLLYLSQLADAGLELGAGVREVSAHPERVGTVVPAVLTARMAVGLVLAVVVAGLGVGVLPQPDGAVLAVAALSLGLVGAGPRWVHYGFDRGGLVSLWRTVSQVVVVGLIVLLVRHPEDVARVPLAQFVGEAVLVLALLAALARGGLRLPVRWDWAVARPVLRRAAPLVGSTLLGLTIYNSDLVFLRLFTGAHAAGLYAAAYLLVSFSINLGQAYTTSLLPSLTRLEPDRASQSRLYHTGMAHMLALGVPIALGGYLLAGRIMPTIFGAEYGPAIRALQWLVWSVPLSLVRDIPVHGLIARGYEARVVRITGWSTGLNVLLNVTLIPLFGLLGAAVATVATEAVRLLLALWVGRGAALPSPSPARLWRPLVAGVLMAGVVMMLPDRSLWFVVPIGALAYGAGLVLVGGVSWVGGRPLLRL